MKAPEVRSEVRAAPAPQPVARAPTSVGRAEHSLVLDAAKRGGRAGEQDMKRMLGGKEYAGLGPRGRAELLKDYVKAASDAGKQPSFTIVKKMLASGINPDAKLDDGKSLRQYASSMSRSDPYMGKVASAISSHVRDRTRPSLATQLLSAGAVMTMTAVRAATNAPVSRLRAAANSAIGMLAPSAPPPATRPVDRSLLRAVTDGDPRAMSRLLRQGADIDAYGRNGTSIRQIAEKTRNPTIRKVLADAAEWNRSPVGYIAERGREFGSSKQPTRKDVLATLMARADTPPKDLKSAYDMAMSKGNMAVAGAVRDFVAWRKNPLHAVTASPNAFQPLTARSLDAMVQNLGTDPYAPSKATADGGKALSTLGLALSTGRKDLVDAVVRSDLAKENPLRHHVAATKGLSVEDATHMLKRWHDPMERGPNGLSARDVAAKLGRDDLVKLFDKFETMRRANPDVFAARMTEAASERKRARQTYLDEISARTVKPVVLRAAKPDIRKPATDAFAHGPRVGALGRKEAVSLTKDLVLPALEALKTKAGDWRGIASDFASTHRKMLTASASAVAVIGAAAAFGSAGLEIARSFGTSPNLAMSAIGGAAQGVQNVQGASQWLASMAPQMKGLMSAGVGVSVFGVMHGYRRLANMMLGQSLVTEAATEATAERSYDGLKAAALGPDAAATRAARDGASANLRAIRQQAPAPRDSHDDTYDFGAALLEEFGRRRNAKLAEGLAGLPTAQEPDAPPPYPTVVPSLWVSLKRADEVRGALAHLTEDRISSHLDNGMRETGLSRTDLVLNTVRYMLDKCPNLVADQHPSSRKTIVVERLFRELSIADLAASNRRIEWLARLAREKGDLLIAERMDAYAHEADLRDRQRKYG